MDRKTKQVRHVTTQLQTRARDDSEMHIEGYFIVFNRETELWPGAFEEVAPEALDGLGKTMGLDVKALNNHDPKLVLGRTKAGTLNLKVDEHGLWGDITINPNDSDAVNLYERVKRGDIDQCSFGFNITSEETEWRDDGTVKWRITGIDLHEVSVVTFPAYEDTGVQARKEAVEQHRERLLEARKTKLKERLRRCLGS